MAQESLETKKHKQDYGRVIGKAIMRAVSKKIKKKSKHGDDEQSASLLKHNRMSSVSTMNDHDDFQPAHKPVRQEAPSYREVSPMLLETLLGIYALIVPDP